MADNGSADHGPVEQSPDGTGPSRAVEPQQAPVPRAAPHTGELAPPPQGGWDSAQPMAPMPRFVMTSAEQFWYVLQCIAFGAGYFAKVPVKRALNDAGLVQMTSAEQFWYVLQCIAFGAGYFAKVPVKRALNDAGLVQMSSAEHVWYVLQCIAFGAGYFAKIPVCKALNDARLLQMTGAGQFWYVLQCLAFGAGYFNKVPNAKAISEVPRLPAARFPA